jgi:uncharacterized repeat protein (TIGR01451 family)
MSRKSFYLLALMVITALFFAVIDLPALAAPLGQEQNPPERLHPDQYSYHGMEELPYLKPGNSPSGGEALLPDGPEQWSRMTFETYVDSNWEISIANGDFSNPTRLTYNVDYYDIQPRLNRGCTRIVFSAERPDYSWDIFSMNTDGTGRTMLTSNNTDDVYPAWSPDGTRIAFQSYRDGNPEVYVMNADGSGQTNLTWSSDYDGMPTWSPDGSRIAFISRRTGGYRIYVMNTDGSNPIMLSQQPYSEDPVWSPDGSKIVYDADADGDGWQEIWVMNADGSNQYLHTDMSGDNNFWANGWSPDGQWVTYTQLHLINYGGQWYWDYAFLYKAAVSGGSGYLLNPGRTTDWNVDWKTSDALPPFTGMNPLASPVPYQFTVSWWGVDDGPAGMLNFDVQMREGSGGVWTDWQMGTTATSATFTGLGGHDYYFRVRGRDQAYNLQPWPIDYNLVVRVESSAPVTQVDQLDALIRGTSVTVTWDGYDLGGSGIKGFDIQYKDGAGGIWQNWLTNTPAHSEVFTGQSGHTYYFRSRGTDNAMNVEAWPPENGDATTTFYSWLTAGTARDNTGVPVSGMDITVNPQAFLTYPTDVDGDYSAYLSSNPEVKTITWSKSGYGTLPATDYGLPDANVDVYLPPVDNVVQDPGFESGILPGSWNAGGEFTPTLDSTFYHSGDYAASLGVSQSLAAPVAFGNLITSGSFEPFATDSQGGVHVAWINWDNGYSIYYAHRLPDGTWLPTELVAQPDYFPLDRIRIAVDGYQNVQMLISGDSGNYYTWRDSGGNWSTLTVVYSSGWLTGMIVDDSSTLHALISQGSGLLYARRIHGGGWEIESVPNVGWLSTASFAIDPQGRVHLVWTIQDYTGSRVMYTLRHSDGSWSDPVSIAQADFAYSVDIILDSAGAPHTIWGEGNDVNRLHYSHMNPDGSWTAPFDFSGGTSAYHFSLMMDDQDMVYVVWNDTRWEIGAQAIYFAQKDSRGNWSEPLNISNSGGVSDGVDAAISSSGDIYTIWDEDNNGVVDVFYARRHAGVWSTPVQLSNTPIYSIFPRVIVDAMGGMNMAWVESDGVTSSLEYIGAVPITQTGVAWISQSLTVPVSMTNPALSFLVSLSGVSDISGNEFRLTVSTDLTDTTTLYTSTTPTNWEHVWFDMTPWSGQEITLTFELSETAGYPPASALLDEVTLGSAHPDTWVSLSGGTLGARPGDHITYQLDYGNRGGALAASSAITLTLPSGLNFVDASIPPVIVGDQLVWQVGDLPAGSDLYSISLTVEVDAAAQLGDTVVTSVEITTASPELETLNNSAQSVTFLGYLALLPITHR